MSDIQNRPDQELTPGLRHRQSLLKWASYGVLAIAILAASYGGWWYVVSSQLNTALDHWIEEQKRQGTDIQVSSRVVSGFPGAVEITSDAPSVTHTGKTQWNWAADRLSLSIKPWAINKIDFMLGRNHRGFYSVEQKPSAFQIQLSEAAGTLYLRSGRFHSVDLRLRNLKAETSHLIKSAEISDADLSLTMPDGSPPEFFVRLRDLQIPQELNPPLGNRLEHLDVRGQLTGDLLSGPWPDVLAHWRQSGGTIDISRLDLSYLPLRLRGNGTIALDEDLQPVAAFSVQANGFFETVDALHRQGLIPLGTTFATKIALGVLSKKPENGGEAYLEMPLTVQDQVVYAGTIALFKLRPVLW